MAVEIEQVRKVGGKDEKGRKAVVVKLGCREQKKSVMEKKGKLKNRKDWIEEDLTWKEWKVK